ncbi:hypothetical protein LOS24_02990 [Enterococcus faecium]|nr:hypothetical protein [Enterococcus faecium]
MKMGIWLRKAVLFAAVLGALGAVSKTVEASASEFIRSRYFDPVRYGKIWCKIL